MNTMWIVAAKIAEKWTDIQIHGESEGKTERVGGGASEHGVNCIRWHGKARTAEFCPDD